MANRITTVTEMKLRETAKSLPMEDKESEVSFQEQRQKQPSVACYLPRHVQLPS